MQRAVAEMGPGRPDLGQQLPADAKELEQLVVPVERFERAEHRARRIGLVRRVHTSAGELPHEPRIDRAERKIGALVPLEQPFELRRREVRVGYEARALAQQVDRELGAALRRAPVLPDDGGGHGLAGAPVPHDRGLTLVRDRDRVGLVDESLASRVENAAPDLLGIVLDPACPRKVLRQLDVAAAADLQLLVDEQARRPRRALVDREDQRRHGSPRNQLSSSLR